LPKNLVRDLLDHPDRVIAGHQLFRRDGHNKIVLLLDLSSHELNVEPIRPHVNPPTPANQPPFSAACWRFVRNVNATI
jgi:hypothetical protein